MRTKQVTVYTLTELKEQFPDAFERVHSRWEESCNEYSPWRSETMDSLKAVIACCGATLRDWSIDAYSHSYVRVDVPENAEELTGPRLLRWWENNALADLRISWTGAKRWELSKYGRYYRPGMVKPCPFTGYCADDSFLAHVRERIIAGDTLKDALESLAGEASEMMEADDEQQRDEESMFANWGENEYDEDGDEI